MMGGYCVKSCKREVPRMWEHPRAQRAEQTTQHSFQFYHKNTPLEIVELEAFKRAFNAMIAEMSPAQRKRMYPILLEASKHATPSVEIFIKGRLTNENGL